MTTTPCASQRQAAALLGLTLAITAAVLLFLVRSQGGETTLIRVRGAHRDSCATVNASLVAWDEAAGRCVPDVCGGARLSDLVDVPGRVSAGILCRTRIIDAAHARKCLSNKHVVVLGDSQMSETALDIQMLLSGVGWNATAIDEFLEQAIGDISGPVDDIVFPSPQQVAATPGAALTVLRWIRDVKWRNRHFAVEIPAINATLTYRFTGHTNMSLDLEGIGTFTDPKFKRELECLLGGRKKCARPDFLLINSGIHDAAGDPAQLPAFEARMVALATRLRRLLPTTRVVWLGIKMYHAFNEQHAIAMGLDGVSQCVLADVGLRYVDMASLMHELLPLGTNVSAYSRDKLHWGAITAYNGTRTHMTVTQMTTQKALAAMCD